MYQLIKIWLLQKQLILFMMIHYMIRLQLNHYLHGKEYQYQMLFLKVVKNGQHHLLDIIQEHIIINILLQILKYLKNKNQQKILFGSLKQYQDLQQQKMLHKDLLQMVNIGKVIIFHILLKYMKKLDIYHYLKNMEINIHMKNVQDLE